MCGIQVFSVTAFTKPHSHSSHVWLLYAGGCGPLYMVVFHSPCLDDSELISACLGIHCCSGLSDNSAARNASNGPPHLEIRSQSRGSHQPVG